MLLFIYGTWLSFRILILYRWATNIFKLISYILFLNPFLLLLKILFLLKIIFLIIIILLEIGTQIVALRGEDGRISSDHGKHCFCISYMILVDNWLDFQKGSRSAQVWLYLSTWQRRAEPSGCRGSKWREQACSRP